MMVESNNEELKNFLEILGLREEPLGVYYTDQEPKEGFFPKPRKLPTAEEEREGSIDWGSVFENFSCVLGIIWRARKKRTAAFFSREHFGCLGGAFYLGFAERQLNFIAHFVSTGIPNRVEGERYLESPDVTRTFFSTISPRPAPARFCVFKPLSQFVAGEKPELVIFFARSEIICGLHQLVTFVTNDFEAVCSPFGPGCAGILTWPLRFLSQGKLKAVLAGWDPSERRYMKTDELSFTVPPELYKRMITRWRDSFLTTKTWVAVQKKIERSYKTWGEE
ncbi:MAG: DUF169 domain-containing protein [Pseudomonadota bacterium]